MGTSALLPSSLGAAGLTLASLGWWWLRRRGLADAVGTGHDLPADFLPQPRLPEGAHLTVSHLWITSGAPGEVRIGLDPLVEESLGPPDWIDVPATGGGVRRGGPLFSARWGHRSVLFISPLDGTVRPAGTGAGDRLYVLTVQLAHGEGDLAPLPSAEAAERWFGREWSRLREFVALRALRDSTVLALPDGGRPARGWLAGEPDETWDRFVDSFLNHHGATGAR